MLSLLTLLAMHGAWGWGSYRERVLFLESIAPHVSLHVDGPGRRWALFVGASLRSEWNDRHVALFGRW
jgi:hypothetical protein